MWEKIRYIFVALVVLAAAMSFVPWTAEAEPGDHFTSDYIYNKHGDTVEITKYIGDGIDVVIPSEIEGMPVTSLGDYAFYQCFDLISVTIPGSVTRIGNEAFSYCESLKSITFKGNAPSIGSQWIFGASSDLTIYYNEGATGFDGPAWKDLSLQVISTLKGGSDDGLIVIGLVVFVAIAILAALLYMRKR